MTIGSLRRTISRVRTADATEAIAVEIFRQAESSGQLVTMSVIERALERLRAHRASCKCGLCEAAAKVAADRVYRVAASWQAQIAVTRRRATR
jgi:hypothetical protein